MDQRGYSNFSRFPGQSGHPLVSQYRVQADTSHIDWLFNVNTDRSICVNCRGGKLAQAAKDSQRDTIYITLRYTITM